MENIEKLKNRINNNGKKIQIRLRKLPSGKHSIYLDYQKMINGKKYRERKMLGLFVTGETKSKLQDKENIGKAEAIRDEYEANFSNSSENVFSSSSKYTLADGFKGFIKKTPVTADKIGSVF